jgi:hypothetical protein
MVIFEHVQALLYHQNEHNYGRSEIVRLWGILSSIRYKLYCICGVEVLQKVTFMPIDLGSFNVNIMSRVIGSIQGTLAPWLSQA